MAKIKVDTEEFFALLPLLILTAIKNDNLLDENTSNFFHDVEIKVLPTARQYFLKTDPDLRRKIKFLLKGIESSNNTVITIKGNPDSEITTEEKYLSKDYKNMTDIAKKYLHTKPKEVFLK